MKKIGKKTHHKFNIDNKTWKKVWSHLTGQRERYCAMNKNNGKFINASVWILRTKLSWRDLTHYFR